MPESAEMDTNMRMDQADSWPSNSIYTSPNFIILKMAMATLATKTATLLKERIFETIIALVPEARRVKVRITLRALMNYGSVS